MDTPGIEPGRVINSVTVGGLTIGPMSGTSGNRTRSHCTLTHEQNMTQVGSNHRPMEFPRRPIPKVQAALPIEL